MAKKDRYWGGWDEFRYGVKKPITLPRVFKGDKQKALVGKVTDLMRDWRSTPFEKEGVVRAGIRSALCAQGHCWPLSDSEAERVVNNALMTIGAKRPSWDEGQREYSLGREHCAWCSGAVPEELMATGKAVRFCSEMCARSALEQKDFERRRTTDTAYAAAIEIIQRARNSVRKCQLCSKSFRPIFEGGIYCSHECATTDSRTVSVRKCATCSKEYRPANNKGKYCSRECGSVGRITRPTLMCRVCAEPYVPRKPSQLYCSQPCVSKAVAMQVVDCTCECCGGVFQANRGHRSICGPACYNLMYKMRTGQPPKLLAPHVFDYLVKHHTVRQVSNVIYLTPEHFDRAFTGQKSIPAGNAFSAAEAFDRLFG